jgi:ABC-type uncharacterized transport system involved in gliding motility auxiliary subunit
MASKPRSLSAKRAQYGAYSALYVIIVLAALATLNWLADQNNKSFDTTTNKQFSLSEQTIKTVRNLKHDVSVTYFDQARSFQTARDLLDRYSNLSNKLHVAYVDPDKKPDVAKADGFRVMGGVVVQSGAKTEEAAALTEEGVTNAIIRAIKTGQKTVCFASGSGEPGLDDTERTGLSFAKEQLEKNTYKTSTFSFLEKTEIPADCSAVVIAGPSRDYIPAAVDALKKYVEGGGHVLFAIGPAISLEKGQDNSGSPAIAQLLDGWGVTLDKDLVLDFSGAGQFFGFNEAAPIVVAYESQPIVRDLVRIATVFPLSRSLTIASGKGVDKLFSTTARSLSTENLSLPIKVDPDKAKKGPFVLGAAGSVGSGAKQGRFVVVGSATWMANTSLSISQVGNRDLFLNMINWLSSDEDLISIRPKDPEDRRISMTGNQMRMLFFSTVVFLPLLSIISGVAVWWKRR